MRCPLIKNIDSVQLSYSTPVRDVLGNITTGSKSGALTGLHRSQKYGAQGTGYMANTCVASLMTWYLLPIIL